MEERHAPEVGVIPSDHQHEYLGVDGRRPPAVPSGSHQPEESREEPPAGERERSEAPQGPRLIPFPSKAQATVAESTQPLADFLRELIAALERGDYQVQGVVIHTLVGPTRQNAAHLYWRHGMSQIEHLGLLAFAQCGVYTESGQS